MMNEFLEKIGACRDAKIWAKNKSWKEIFETCHRGDWLLWLFKRTNPDDLKRLTLAKAHCANTVRHLIKDERSKKAIDVAISFGEGVATREELDASYADAYASYAADAYAYASYAADAAKTKNQLLTADICRKYLPIEIWNIKN